jgi:hypothetical protein
VTAHRQTNVVLIPERGPSRIEEKEGVIAAAIRCEPAAVQSLLSVLEPAVGRYETEALSKVKFIVVTSERFSERRYPW